MSFAWRVEMKKQSTGSRVQQFLRLAAQEDQTTNSWSLFRAVDSRRRGLINQEPKGFTQVAKSGVEGTARKKLRGAESLSSDEWFALILVQTMGATALRKQPNGAAHRHQESPR